jgi:hypothetical protein
LVTLRDVTASTQEWISAFAAQLGVAAPSDAERDTILALAGTAAHASERTAAPIACWLAAKAGLSAQKAETPARGIDPAVPHDEDPHPA